MKYDYASLSHEQFEELVTALCQELLGMSVQPFAKGPDGGKDAKFIGRAKLIPSESKPWNGKTIIQAKHTINYNGSFSGSDFFSSNSHHTVIGKEIPKIKKLRENGQLDHYMLFSNRRLTGIREQEICSYISNECGIGEESILLCGLEKIELWLKKFQNVAESVSIDPIDSPLNVSPDELAEIVEALAKNIGPISKEIHDSPITRIPYEVKNASNDMSDAYAEKWRKKFLKDTGEIRKFLYSPENENILLLYENVVEEFESKIIAKRKDYQRFDNVINYLIDSLFKRDAVLRQDKHKRLTIAMIFYMYWNCDIGGKYDDKT